jgi:hypothetical protein
MVLDCLFERRPPFDMGNTITEVARILGEREGCAGCLGGRQGYDGDQPRAPRRRRLRSPDRA